MNQSRLAQPIDKLAIALIVFLTLIIGFLVWGGHACDDQCLFHAGARVNNFTWQNRTIGGQDRAFILTFNRPMDRLSVETNLKIAPPLPGKISWSGLRMAYTLDNPVPYGETYRLTLLDARDRFPNQEQAGSEIQPFRGQFRSRDRAFAYIGTKGQERSRLVLSNWTTQQKTILTPKNLAVFDFKPYPQGDRLLFSAADTSQSTSGIPALQLYTVPTQFNTQNKTDLEIELILDARQYQNNKFDISQDGKTIVVQRLNRDNPEDYGLWKLVNGQSPQLISNNQVGDFLITPDSQAVAVAQGEGIALLSLKAKAKPLDFLPKFGQVLDFARDGTGAAMIDYNTDSEELKYTRSLVYVNNQGVEKQLLNTDGSIQNCQFAPTAKHLYCWLTELVRGEVYIEQPYLAEINLETGTIKTLVTMPKYQESQISVAPDGLGVLFERREARNLEASPGLSLNNIANNVPGNAASIWLAIPERDLSDTTTADLEQLPFLGFHPQWLP